MYAIRTRNVEQALAQGLAALASHGFRTTRRGMDVIEMPVPVATAYTNPRERVLFNPIRDANPFFHFFESLWILAGRNDVAFLAHLLPRMAQYSDDGKTFHGAYGHRLRHWQAMPDISTSWEHTDIVQNEVDQIKGAITLLKEKPDTRQCVLSIWNPELDLGTVTNDMPCNDMVILSRGGVGLGDLNMTVCNRSNDAVWGAYGANAVQFSMLQEYIAAKVGCSVGTYTQMSNNFHVYEDNPYWLEYKTRKNELLGYTSYYAQDIVKPYDLFAEDGFDADLTAFFQLFDEVTGTGAAVTPKYETQAFNDVVAPMWECLLLYKSGFIKDAWVMTNDIAALDWQSACAEWLARRITKRGL